jgi:hypothetical protein
LTKVIRYGTGYVSRTGYVYGCVYVYVYVYGDGDGDGDDDDEGN